MAPIDLASFSVTPLGVAMLLALIGLLIAVVMVMLCADGDNKDKARPMTKLPDFTDLGMPADSAPSAKDKKINIGMTVPLQNAGDPVGPSKKGGATEKLKIDAMQCMKKRFKDDRTLERLLVDEKRLQTTEIIGQGNFGLVYKGVMLDRNMANPKDVAVKTVHGATCTIEDVEMFIKESSRMRGFAHQHVMCMIGISTRESKPYIIIPYMENGDLKSYMMDKNKKFTLESLLKLGYQVAQGMNYLSEKNFIHRDLAARNCMVGADTTVKVADFGLSRDLYSADYYKMADLKTPLPIRWVAIEAIVTSKFTTKSDVWSFGVVMWELVTRGRTPYSEVKGNLQVVNHLKAGNRLQCPAYVTGNVNQLMQTCWRADPKDRPTFRQICNQMHTILEDDDYMKPKRTGKQS